LDLKSIQKKISLRTSGNNGFSATQNNDKIGLILFSDQIELYIPSQKGRSHVLRIIAGLMSSIHKATRQLSQALRFCQHTKAIVFVFPDFMS
jgi:uncharacterized protein (DUF58 family)